ncbi:MAG: hypothetical protein ACQES7_04200 [Pseudomonadota bacterium]
MNNFDKAEAIEDLFHCHDKRKLAKMVVELQGDIQEMVAKAAANKLDGYRELSERACKAEEERDAALGREAALAAHVERLRKQVFICHHHATYSVGDADALTLQITKIRTAAYEALKEQPTASLDRRDLLKQAENWTPADLFKDGDGEWGQREGDYYVTRMYKDGELIKTTYHELGDIVDGAPANKPTERG